jgi:hypothetical protein
MPHAEIATASHKAEAKRLAISMMHVEAVLKLLDPALRR